MEEVMQELANQLQKPFSADDIEWRVQSSGTKNGKAWAMIMPYVTNRAIQERLDEVFGVMGWSNEFTPIKGERGLSFLCGIKVQYDGLFTTKWDGADETAVENFKGGISNAMKRTGVQYGIGRYLYNLSTYFADLREDRKGKFTAVVKDGSSKKYFSFNAPKLPPWALPSNNIPAQYTPEPVKEVFPEATDVTEEEKKLSTDADACNTMDELAKWYSGLTSKDKASGSYAQDVKNRRKTEIANKITKGETEEPKMDKSAEGYRKRFDEHKKFSIDAMKANENLMKDLKELTVPELHKRAEDLELAGYKKLKKTDLIIFIMDKVNDHRSRNA